jgi:hypothetical protein
MRKTLLTAICAVWPLQCYAGSPAILDVLQADINSICAEAKKSLAAPLLSDPAAACGPVLRALETAKASKNAFDSFRAVADAHSDIKGAAVRIAAVQVGQQLKSVEPRSSIIKALENFLSASIFPLRTQSSYLAAPEVNGVERKLAGLWLLKSPEGPKQMAAWAEYRGGEMLPGVFYEVKPVGQLVIAPEVPTVPVRVELKQDAAVPSQTWGLVVTSSERKIDLDSKDDPSSLIWIWTLYRSLPNQVFSITLDASAQAKLTNRAGECGTTGYAWFGEPELLERNAAFYSSSKRGAMRVPTKAKSLFFPVVAPNPAGIVAPQEDKGYRCGYFYREKKFGWSKVVSGKSNN